MYTLVRYSQEQIQCCLQCELDAIYTPPPTQQRTEIPAKKLTTKATTVPSKSAETVPQNRFASNGKSNTQTDNSATKPKTHERLKCVFLGDSMVNNTDKERMQGFHNVKICSITSDLCFERNRTSSSKNCGKHGRFFRLSGSKFSLTTCNMPIHDLYQEPQ